ncbi:hypothetical protein GCM10023065_15520 [Microbacterium laevaniformans]|uniref:ComEA family DNA-binding protein n=1 Tax=Microbacterium laevaniformans TaxID=36807 RepID=UPI00195D8FE1|nr:ComEA family DNA-binding protein [Microbacterium laevaniformans]GLJ65041.1 hypothetical protein GCM10017578_19300 [Microbacterium laevaniformans]
MEVSPPGIDHAPRTAADAHRARRRRVGTGAALVLVLAAAAIAVAVGLVRSVATADTGVAVAPVEISAAALYVHVSGAVERPGLYRLDGGARVVDVVSAAGGFTDTADRTAVNLARPLVDGEQVQVPEVGEAPSTGAPVSGDGRVNLNTADVAALDALPRVGPAIAERIIAWREENGGFTSVDDLLSVPGIGEKMLAGLRDLVTV